MENPLELTELERFRLRIVKLALSRKITQRKAAERMGLSERQTRRLCARVRAHDGRGVIHGLRGKPAHNRSRPGIPIPGILRTIRSTGLPAPALRRLADTIEGVTPAHLDQLLARFRL